VTGERVYSVYKLVLKHTQTQTHRPATGHDSRGGESVLQLRGKPGKHALTHTHTRTRTRTKTHIVLGKIARTHTDTTLTEGQAGQGNHSDMT